MRPGTPIELKSLNFETPLERLFQLYIAAKRLESVPRPGVLSAARRRVPQSTQVTKSEPVAMLVGHR